MYVKDSPMKTILVTTAVVVVLASFPAFATGVADRIEVEQPMVRAVAAGVPVSGAHMILRNDDGADHALAAAHSDVAENVELHTHTMENGMMTMRKVDAVSLPAHQTVRFEPGGLHIMLIGLTRTIKAGDTVDISLEFEDGSRKDVSFSVH
jgi:copper(I)-binding protein